MSKFKCDIFRDFQTFWTSWFNWHFKNYICVFGAKIQMISQWGKVLHKMWIPWLLILANLIMKANRCARPQFWTWRALIVGKKRWLNEDIYNSARAQELCFHSKWNWGLKAIITAAILELPLVHLKLDWEELGIPENYDFTKCRHR